MMTEELIEELPKGILKWYPFCENAQILDLSNSLLQNTTQEETLNNLKNFEVEKQYDYIIGIHILEYSKNPKQLLEQCKKLLKPDGKLLLGMDNRLGIRYFCGDRDPFTGRNFDGVEAYRRVSTIDLNKINGRVWDKNIVMQWLKEVGFYNQNCLSVLPNIDAPQLFYAQDYLPEEELSIRYIPYYNNPDTVFLEEAYLYDGLIKNNLFHQMANGYFIECSLNETECVTSNIRHITLSMDRGKEFARATILHKNDTVEKKAIYHQGIKSLQSLQKNSEDLKAHGIEIVEGKMIESSYVMPYINAEIGIKHLQNLLRIDKEAFIQEMDSFRQLILQSSEHIEPVLSDYEKREQSEISEGIWLKKGYFDLVPLNAFYMNGKYVFFDQEFCIENYPANVIIVRLVDIVYSHYDDLEEILPRTFFWKRYGIEEQLVYLRKLSWEFLYKLRNQKQLKVYNEKHGMNYEMIHSNRQRMNFSVDEYQKLFVNIFDGLDKYKILLFGSGNFAAKFIDLYGSKYHIEGILDNNEKKWKTDLKGIEIYSPDILKNKNLDEYKIIICIKNYLGVLCQLKEMGVSNLGIYDTNMIYPMIQVIQRSSYDIKHDEGIKKKYHTGYIAGVFDLYHIGHLNIFKRAKEQCEYLIVGVVTDEGVRKNKKTVPFIPFEERLEMVRSCKYVDEAVEIPFHFGGTRDAYRLYHFDVQFSGSDYENDPNWLAEKEFLQKHGSDMVFFPYTEQTSSTKIKALIEKKLT